MEHCNGGNLQQLMEAKGRKLEKGVIQKIMAQLRKGYQALSENLIVHRDIQASNIMIHFKG